MVLNCVVLCFIFVVFGLCLCIVFLVILHDDEDSAVTMMVSIMMTIIIMMCSCFVFPLFCCLNASHIDSCIDSRRGSQSVMDNDLRTTAWVQIMELFILRLSCYYFIVVYQLCCFLFEVVVGFSCLQIFIQYSGFVFPECHLSCLTFVFV